MLATLMLLALLDDAAAARGALGTHPSGPLERTLPRRFADVQAEIARGHREADAIVRRFVERAGGTPIIEERTAIFLVESDAARPPRIDGDVPCPLERLQATRFFFCRVELPADARIEYMVVSSDGEKPDPLNPRRVDGFFGPQSELRMPGYVPVVAREEDAAVPRGTLVSLEHRSTLLGNTRRVHVYLPPGYDATAERRYPEVWLGDGTTYVEQLSTPRLLDRLIAGGTLEPVVAVLVDPVDRRLEYGLHDGFRRMIVTELVPRIAASYRVEARATRRFLGGGSRGGQAAIDLCLAAPETFGLCGAWAPAIAPRTAGDVLAGRRTGNRFVLLRALYDDRFGPDAPALRDGLEALGAKARYLEAPQGHNLGSWPDLMARVLLETFPAASSAARAMTAGPRGRDAEDPSRPLKSVEAPNYTGVAPAAHKVLRTTPCQRVAAHEDGC